MQMRILPRNAQQQLDKREAFTTTSRASVRSRRESLTRRCPLASHSCLSPDTAGTCRVPPTVKADARERRHGRRVILLADCCPPLSRPAGRLHRRSRRRATRCPWQRLADAPRTAPARRIGAAVVSVGVDNFWRSRTGQERFEARRAC